MSDDRPQNRWWRFVPRTRGIGVLAVLAWPVVGVCATYNLVADLSSDPGGVVLQVAFVAVAVWNTVRSVTGLAALRRSSR